MSYVRTIATHRREYINAETGETLGQETDKFERLVKDQQEFFFVYPHMVTAFAELDYAQVKVLVWSSLHTQLNTNEVCLPKLIKQRLAAEMKINERTVDNAIQQLVKKGHFHRLGIGIYHVNPDLCWRGHETNHRRNLKTYLQYKKPSHQEPLKKTVKQY